MSLPYQLDLRFGMGDRFAECFRRAYTSRIAAAAAHVSDHMFPVASVKDGSNRSAAYAVVYGEVNLRHRAVRVKDANLSNVLFCEFRSVVLFAVWGFVAALLIHVPVVVRFAAEKKVGRITAGAVIAPVADACVRRDLAIYKHPCDAACRLLLTTKAESAVTIHTQGAQPVPAFIFTAPVNIAPKPLIRSPRPAATMPRYIAARLPLFVAQSCAGHWGDRSFLPATAVAVAERNFCACLHGTLYTRRVGGGTCH